MTTLKSVIEGKPRRPGKILRTEAGREAWLASAGRAGDRLREGRGVVEDVDLLEVPRLQMSDEDARRFLSPLTGLTDGDDVA